MCECNPGYWSYARMCCSSCNRSCGNCRSCGHDGFGFLECFVLVWIILIIVYALLKGTYQEPQETPVFIVPGEPNIEQPIEESPYPQTQVDDGRYFYEEHYQDSSR